MATVGKIKLDNESYAKLLQAERNLTDIVEEFSKLEECGVECQEFRRIQSQYLEQISAMKKYYAPGTP